MSNPNLPTTARTAPHRQTARRLATFTIAVLIAVLHTISAQAQANVIATIGQVGEVELPIGSDLFVDWPDAPKNSLVQISLLGPTGAVVTTREISVGADGWSDPEPLWFISGVQGCDAKLDGESPFRYPTFEAALFDLLGDTFTLVVTGQAGGVPVRIVVPEQPLYYFSDSAGCPRSLFARTETQYLSAWAAGAGDLPTELTLFIEREGCPPHTDVRHGPQLLEIPPSSQVFTAEIGTSCSVGCGALKAWVRPSHQASCFDSENTACGPQWCVPTKSDIAVHAVGPEVHQFDGPLGVRQSRGKPSTDYDDMRCDLCDDDADQGGG